MKTLLPFLIASATFVGVTFSLHAQDAPKERTTGKVLLLKTGHAMEGDIDKIGTQLRIRRGNSEVRIAADTAVRLCADWDDAFAFALSTIKADDANDRVKLARWCHLNGLTQRALDQAKVALELQPLNTEAKQIFTLLERAVNEPTPKSPPVPIVAPRPMEAAPTVDVSFETLIAFTTKVQPILMNTCASCHAGNSTGKFHLERVADSGQKASTQRNLAAVLSYIDLEHPAISPLLVKAVTRHGDAAAPPIRDRSAKPALAIQQWVDQTIAKNPQLKDYAAKKHGPGKANPEPKSVFPTQRSQAPAKGDDVISEQVPRLEIDERNPPRVQPEPVTRTPTVQRDWCDPDHFNEHFHPQYFRQQSVSTLR